ncbi:hypothetical protein TEA_012916 [Camellia sinensis var. sinensis]|uniref:NAP1-related protein 2 n=1 Tax=Camellia sinensis var. sinensis TaxID=542762 RepID=A0A4S4DPV4_CAMSN|nr:hypothetical protein TEA_012916 [Camellia sinensis var. sinensis]
MVADRGKKSKVADRTQDEHSDHIDTDLVLSIEKLQEFNEEASEKVLEVEQKYNEIRRPVYVKRNEIINSIPDFWLTAFLSHPALGDLLSEEDSKIFKYLDSLDVEDFKDVKLGYSITFNFKPNPYFEDTKLTKTFTFFDEGTTKITGTNIKWKEGMGAANGVNHEKKGNKRLPSDESAGKVGGMGALCLALIIKPLGLGWAASNIPYATSFFSWFSETQQKDILEGLHDEVAEIIKEDLWPNPLKYFNNEADEEDSDGDEDDDEEKGDDDDEDVDAGLPGGIGMIDPPACIGKIVRSILVRYVCGSRIEISTAMTVVVFYNQQRLWIQGSYRTAKMLVTFESLKSTVVTGYWKGNQSESANRKQGKKHLAD